MPSSRPTSVALFDLVGSLASVRLTETGDAIDELDVHPEIPVLLAALRTARVRVGILARLGNVAERATIDALRDAASLGDVDPDLIFHVPARGRRPFAVVRERAGARARVLYVGEDATARTEARGAGLLAAPHPRLARAVIDRDGPVWYVGITAPRTMADAVWRATLRTMTIVPLHVAGAADTSTVLYAIGTASAARQLEALDFHVDRIGAADAPLASDLYLFDSEPPSLARPARRSTAGGRADVPPGHEVLASTTEGLLVAVTDGHLPARSDAFGALHVHACRLNAAPSLLGGYEVGAPAESVETADDPRCAPGGTASRLAAHAAVPLTPAEVTALVDHVTEDGVRRDVDRYSGAAELSPGMTIRSRHVAHDGNADAVAALASDLRRVGAGRLVVRRVPFDGGTLENVEATLPGAPVGASPPGVIIVSAHLDSIADLKQPYDPHSDDAPGADDDASGIAGVLAAARAMIALAGASTAPRREIRFVLFNAEEVGKRGSAAYAEAAAATTPRVRIDAVFQMDMIGFATDPVSTFEVHGGCFLGDVQAGSLALASRIAAVRAQVSPEVAGPEFYPDPPNGTLDPAERRSDHHSFHLRNYPACLVTEDQFAHPMTGAPPTAENPDYHLPTDERVVAGYLAGVARAVAAAAWHCATR